MAAKEQNSSTGHLGLNHEWSIRLKTNALVERFLCVIVGLKSLVNSVVTRPQKYHLIVGVFAGRDINAEVLATERTPVSRMTRLIFPLLVIVFLSSSNDKLCTSGFFVLFNSDNKVSVKSASNMTCCWIKEEKFMLVVLRFADSHLVLSSSNMIAPEQNSVASHSGLNHEVLTNLKMSALVDWFGNFVGSLKHLVLSFMMAPYNHTLSIHISVC